MRTPVLTVSLSLVLFSGLAAAQAQERVAQTQPAASWEETGDGGDEYPTDDSGHAIIPPKFWFTAPTYGAYFQADVLYLERLHNVHDIPIAVDLPPTSATVLSTNDAKLSNHFRPGAMFTLGWNLDQVAQFEGTYWGLNSWTNSASATDPAGLLGLAGTLQNNTVDYIFADRMQIDYESHINNAEANYKQTIEGLTVLAGFRYFRLLETFNINSHSSLIDEASDYKVTAVNQLIGLQLGLGQTQQWGGLQVGVLGKIGAYGNMAHQTTLLQDLGNSIILRQYKAGATPVSSLAELGVNASYQITDWLSIHAGYRFIWVYNVALAPDQLDLSNSPPGTTVMNPHNHLMMQGLNGGVEIRW